MLAMVLEEYGRQLTKRDIPIPVPGPGEVLLRVLACGVCGTDVKIAAGKIQTARTPLIMGHEPVGRVIECGPGVTGFLPGDRVAVWIYVTCGTCEHCLKGRHVLCPGLRRVGFERPGGFSEYMVVPAANLVAIPDSITDTEAAVLGCAVSTMFRAVNTRGRVQPGEWVLVMGVGGLGVHGVQIGKSVGARVIAVDVDERRLELATRYGADEALPFSERALDADVRMITGGRGADVVLETVGLGNTLSVSMACLGSGGRLVMVGYSPSSPFEVESPRVVLDEIEIIGSRAMTRKELIGAIDLLARGAVKAVVSACYPLEDVNVALEELRQGRVMGRAVLVPAVND
ncbi:MAG: alcohol dehydrogenase catalytic domain-containing protein [Bacillota bacterium]